MVHWLGEWFNGEKSGTLVSRVAHGGVECCTSKWKDTLMNKCYIGE